MPGNQTSTRGLVRRLVVHPGFIVPLALAAVAAGTGGHPSWFLALLLAISAARLASRFRLDAWLPQGVSWLARGLGTLLLGALFVLVVLPVHVLGLWGRRRARRRAGRWVARSAPTGDPRRLGTDPGRTAFGPPRWLAGFGLVALVLVSDQAIGRIWDAADPRADPQDALVEPTLINVSGAEAPRDPRADDPAMGGAPWAEDYFRELNAIRATYWPFVLFRNQPYEGTYVNGDGWTRRSWSPPDPVGFDPPLISFYGGSTTFGIGQRDTRTIPSEVARLAAASGYPVEVANHGMNGFVSWQELLLFEHFTAAGEQPLRAVFYDGVNEVYAQRQPAVIGNPADTQVDDVGERLAGPPADPAATESEPSTTPTNLWDAYRDMSALDRLAARLDPLLGATPAGASPAEPPSQEEIGRAAVAVYERSRALIGHVARDAGITPLFLWQPAPDSDDPELAYRVAADRLTPPTVSLVDCLDDHQDVYLADAHTNEDGARLVAGCIWTHLAPAVRGWYRDQGLARQAPVVDDDDAVVPSSQPADLEVPASLLGPGWTKGVPIPNVLTACAGAAGSAKVTVANGPSFGFSDDDDIGRLTTATIEFASTSDATRARQQLLATGTTCFGRQAVDTLSAEGPVRWSSVPEPDSAPAEQATWTAEVRFGSVEQRGTIHLGLVQQGRTLVAVEATGTRGVEVVEVADRVGQHLAGR